MAMILDMDDDPNRLDDKTLNDIISVLAQQGG